MTLDEMDAALSKMKAELDAAYADVAEKEARLNAAQRQAEEAIQVVRDRHPLTPAALAELTSHPFLSTF